VASATPGSILKTERVEITLAVTSGDRTATRLGGTRGTAAHRVPVKAEAAIPAARTRKCNERMLTSRAPRE